MSEATQGYLGISSESTKVNLGFQSVLNHIREHAQSERQKGDYFERLMQKYFTEDPDYKEQFSEVYLWKHWAELRTEFDGTDIGVDLVAEKHDGEFCAIQCKCYEEATRISKPDIDSFISASASEIFTSRILVNTGGELGENALRTITPLGDKFRIIRFRDLEDSPFEWPDLSIQAPEQLTYKQRTFTPKRPSTRSVRRRYERLQSVRPRQADYGMRHRQNLHRTQNRRANRRNQRQGPLSRPIYQSTVTSDARMVGTTRRTTQLYRYLLGYTRG